MMADLLPVPDVPLASHRVQEVPLDEPATKPFAELRAAAGFKFACQSPKDAEKHTSRIKY